MARGRPRSTEDDKRTEALQVVLTPVEKAAFDQLAREMADELGLGKMADAAVLRRLILAELKRRGIYPPAPPPAPPPARPAKRTTTRRS